MTKHLFILLISVFGLLIQGAANEKKTLIQFPPSETKGDPITELKGKIPPKCGQLPEWDQQTKSLLFNSKDTGLLIPISKKLRVGTEDSFRMDIEFKPLSESPKQLLCLLANEKSGTAVVMRIHSKNRLSLKVSVNGKKFCNFLLPIRDYKSWHKASFIKNSEDDSYQLILDGISDRQPSSTMIEAGGKIYLGGGAKEVNGFNGLIRKFSLSTGKESSETSLKSVYQPVKAVVEKPDESVLKSWKAMDKNKVDIVPAPKKLVLTGEYFKITENWQVSVKSEGLEPGLDEINRKLKELNGFELKNGEAKENIIAVGIFEHMKEYLEKIGNPVKPPKQGYIIDFYTENSRPVIIVAGSDRVGTMYGCITLSRLLKENNSLLAAKITDWPDYWGRMGFTLKALIKSKAELNYNKKIIDQVFRLKLNYVWGRTYYMPLEALLNKAKWRKELSEYAAARGVSIVAGASTNVGEAPMKNLPKGTNIQYYPYKTDEGLVGHRGRAYTWSRDDLLKKKGKEIVQVMQKTGLNFFYLHSMDTGARENPENWNYRTPMDKKRWGNDRAAADANLINIIYAEMKKSDPEAGVSYVEYPYSASYLQYPEIRSWLKKLTEKVDPEIYLCVREAIRPSMEEWRKLTRSRLYIYHDLYPSSLELMFCAAGRYAGTFYFDHDEIYWCLQHRAFQWPSLWVAAEYAWNTNAPGWGYMPKKYGYVGYAESVPVEISSILLPRIMRIAFGQKAAAIMSKIFLSHLSCSLPAEPKKFYGADQLAYFKVKSKQGEEVLKLLDEVKKEVSSSPGLFRITEDFARDGAALNKIRYCSLLARNYLAENKFSEAKKQIAVAEKELAKVKDKHYQKLIKKDLNITEDIKWVREQNLFLSKMEPRNIILGVYTPYGIYKGITGAFKPNSGVKALTFSDPTADNLRDFDVIIFPATSNMWDMTEDWRQTVPEFVKNGGTVIFTHNSVGRYQSSAFGKPLFPEICQGYGDKVTGLKKLKVTKPHPALGELKKDDIVEHEYYDHLWIKPGPKGTVLLVDEKQNPVMVVGKFGQGKVVYTGQIFGYNRSNQPKPSKGAEWKLLYNIVRWKKGQ